MKDIQKILEAFQALAEALPVRTNVNLHDCTADTIRQLAKCGAKIKRYTSEDKTHEWDCASIEGAGCSFYAYSEHRKISAPTDPAAVDVALAKVAEALS